MIGVVRKPRENDGKKLVVVFQWNTLKWHYYMCVVFFSSFFSTCRTLNRIYRMGRRWHFGPPCNCAAAVPPSLHPAGRTDAPTCPPFLPPSPPPPERLTAHAHTSRVTITSAFIALLPVLTGAPPTDRTPHTCTRWSALTLCERTNDRLTTSSAAANFWRAVLCVHKVCSPTCI